MTYQPNQKFATFYGNGVFMCNIIISRVTDKSVFHMRADNDSSAEFRDSINSVDRYVKKGLWKII